MVTRGALFGWMVLGGAAGAVIGEMATVVVTAEVDSSSIGFGLALAAVSLIVILPLSVVMTAVVFVCTLLVRSPGRDRAPLSIVVSLAGTAIVLTIGLLMLDWVRWPETWIPFACAALGAIGGGFVARARAPRPRQNSSWSEG